VVTKGQLHCDHTFKISARLSREIGREFGFVLSRAERTTLEVAARKTIRLRRYCRAEREPDDFDGKREEMDLRHRKIAKTIDLLLDLLREDDGSRGWDLASKRDHFSATFSPHNALLIARFPSCREEAEPILLYLKTLAVKKHRWQSEQDDAPRLRRRKNSNHEGWEFLIFAGIRIFRARKKTPTANYSKSKRAYTTALLRGLSKFHDALPQDVRAPSSASLGSPTAEFIKKSNAHR
jgi:hypothetical protein